MYSFNNIAHATHFILWTRYLPATFDWQTIVTRMFILWKYHARTGHVFAKHWHNDDCYINHSSSYKITTPLVLILSPSLGYSHTWLSSLYVPCHFAAIHPIFNSPYHVNRFLVVWLNSSDKYIQKLPSGRLYLWETERIQGHTRWSGW